MILAESCSRWSRRRARPESTPSSPCATPPAGTGTGCVTGRDHNLRGTASIRGIWGLGSNWEADRPMRAPRPPRLIAGVTAVAALLLSGLACGASPATTTPASSPSAPQDSTAPQSSADTAPRLHVSGNKLLDASGKRVILHGVDRSGGEYACVQGQSIWIGPMNQASVTAMKSWGINAVRIPLNEACWNGESYVNSAYSGSAYRSA